MSDSKNTVMVELTPEQLHLVIKTCSESSQQTRKITTGIGNLIQRISNDQTNYSDAEQAILLQSLNNQLNSFCQNIVAVEEVVLVLQKQFESFEKDNVSTFMTPLPLPQFEA